MSQVLGILGGGQLAMFMCHAARELNVSTIVLSPDGDACAREACDEFILSDYDDPSALQRLGESCDVVTLDNEHIPEEALLSVARHCAVYPQPGVMSRLRDRLLQRGLLTELNVPQVRFWSVDTEASMRAAAQGAIFPAVLKRRHGGYDGYGQAKVERSEDLAAAWDKLAQAPCILEAWVPGVSEFSIVGMRAHDGEIKLYPEIANWHSEGQLVRSDIPAQLPSEIASAAQNIWRQVADGLDYRGVLTIEFFVDQESTLMVNEIAPRVHNSGHVTQLVSPHSQFMAHVRGVLGMSLPDIEPVIPGTMWNIYPQHGLHDPELAQKAENQAGGRILLYGKSARPRRKMGHWLATEEERPLVSEVMKNAEHRDAS